MPFFPWPRQPLRMPARKDLKEPDFPTLRALEELDKQFHAEAAIEAGLTVDQAIRHAKEDHERWSPTDRERKASN
jgi:hypothetical protein